MEKITKKNSILYNQLWINKAIIDGNYHFLPIKKNNLSIGEYIENNYNNYNIKETPKVTKKDSLLFELEWIKKYKEESLKLPKRRVSIYSEYSYGEILELKYFEREILKYHPTSEDELLLPNERKKKVLKKKI